MFAGWMCEWGEDWWGEGWWGEGWFQLSKIVFLFGGTSQLCQTGADPTFLSLQLSRQTFWRC